MALKKKTAKSQEQLYMLEVMVDQVTLNPERTSEITVEDLIVSVKFIDLPQCEISVPTKDTEDADNSKDLGYGKSSLFSKTPSCLIKAIRWSPFCLEVYRKEPASSTNTDRVLLGTAKMSLPACMCNHVIKTQKESKGSTAPFETKNTFNIIDPNNEIFGNVTMVLRLSCFGSSIVKQFSLNEKSFVLEDSPLQKFLCPYLTPTPESKKDEDDSKPLLTRPDSPPRVSMDDPAFKTLTSAEKLNDPKYRELVYRTYPNEPTCRCLPPDRSTHPMKCRSGCNRPCCMKLRNPKILDTHKDKHVDDALNNTYCVKGPLPVLEKHKPCCNSTRLRGGGDIEQLYIGPAGTKWNDDADYSWYDGNHHMLPRLEGGGEMQMSSCTCSGNAVPVRLRASSSKDKDVVTMFDACTPRVTANGPKPSCVCPGKETPTWPRGAAKCMKKPCMGIDCLIRAFQDAQEFVNSIGKVPGLPGLGLMDPSESPYFGRDLDKDYVVTQEPPPEPQKKKTQSGTVQKAEAPRCTAPCSLSVKPSENVRSAAPFAPPVSAGPPIPPRLGIVREAIPVLPEVGLVAAKHKKAHEKREEKADKHKELNSITAGLAEPEIGPCGEPKCKSRRKKPADATSMTQSATTIDLKAQTMKKPKSRRKGKGPKGKSKRRRNPRGDSSVSPDTLQKGKAGKAGQKQKLGPGGDISHPQVPVSRRIMRYVYFVGDYYPGIVYGHRNCIDIPMRVPGNMGWLWNTMSTPGNLKPRLGWKPGAIGRYLYELLQEAKENTLALEDSATSVTTKTEKGKADRGRSERGRAAERGRAKNMRGKGANERGKAASDRDRSKADRGKSERGRTRESERTKSAPSRPKSSSRRRAEKTMSFQTMQQMEGEEEGLESPPTLHIHRKDGTYYVTMYPIRQDTGGEPRLAQPMKPLQFKIVKNKDDASVASSSTASDMEIEFSPPAAVSRYRRKPDVVHVDTQVRQQEIIDAIKLEASKKKDKRKHDADKSDSRRRRDKKQQEADTVKSDSGKRKDKTKGEKKAKK